MGSKILNSRKILSCNLVNVYQSGKEIGEITLDMILELSFQESENEII